MKEHTRVARNAGIAMAGEILNLILTMAGGIIVARYLGAERFGIYSYAMSAVWLAMTLTDLGTGTLVTRDIARDRSLAGSRLPSVFGLRLTLGASLTLVVFLAAPMMGPNAQAVSALRWMAPALILTPLGSYYMIFRATERLDLAAAAQVFSRTAQLLAVIAAAAFKTGINGMICATLAGSAATAIAVFAMVPRHYEPVKIRFDVENWGALVARSFPFFALSILSEVYNRIDHILIPYLDSVAHNGLYGVATRVAMLFTIVPNAVAATVFPYFSRRSTESKEPLRKGAIALYRYLGVIGFGAAVFVGIPAAEWIRLLFGAQFVSAAPALYVLMAVVPLLFFQSVHGSILYALEKQKLLLVFTAISIVFDIVLDVVLIKKMGFVGAAYASLATNSVFFILSYAALKAEFGELSFPRAVAGPAASAAAAGVCLGLTPLLPLYVKIPAAGLVFGVCLIATRSLTKDDIILLKSAARGGSAG